MLIWYVTGVLFWTAHKLGFKVQDFVNNNSWENNLAERSVLRLFWSFQCCHVLSINRWSAQWNADVQKHLYIWHICIWETQTSQVHKSLGSGTIFATLPLYTIVLPNLTISMWLIGWFQVLVLHLVVFHWNAEYQVQSDVGVSEGSYD